MNIDKFIVAEIKALHQSVGTGAITFSRMVEILNERMSKEVQSAMQRAVEEEDTASLRTELERVKKYAKHKDECLLNIADMNLAQQYDIVCTCGLEGGGDNTIL